MWRPKKCRPLSATSVSQRRPSSRARSWASTACSTVRPLWTFNFRPTRTNWNVLTWKVRSSVLFCSVLSLPLQLQRITRIRTEQSLITAIIIRAIVLPIVHLLCAGPWMDGGGPPLGFFQNRRKGSEAYFVCFRSRCR